MSIHLPQALSPMASPPAGDLQPAGAPQRRGAFPRRLARTAAAWLALSWVLPSLPATAVQPPVELAESASPAAAAEAESQNHAESLQRIAADLQYLADDRLAGRETGTPGIEQAAAFIANRFQTLGLNTALFDGTPFQEFTAVSEVLAGPPDQNRLTLRVADAEPEVAEMDRAMRPLALGTSGRVEAPLVFAGYGITAPQAGYDDYAGIDAQGKIVVVLRGEPRGGRPDNPLGGPGPSEFAYFTAKVRNAIDHGAVGLLIVNRGDAIEQDAKLAKGQLDAQLARLAELDETLEGLPAEAVNARQQLLASRAVVRDQLEALRKEVESAPEGLLGVAQAGQLGGDDLIPVASLGRRAFDRWYRQLAPAGLPPTLAELERRIASTMQAQSFPLSDATAILETSVETRDVQAKNVIAELPGRGRLAGETIVIGAHYDHVGMGGAGSLAPGTIAVHNGADDNASGTAVLLEAARRLSLDQSESSRRIVFIAFTAEEKGLLGSKHYVREPRFPLEDTVAMINLDMVGRLNDEAGVTVYGTGTALQFDALADRLGEQTGLPVQKDPSGYGPSDHASFYEKKVPVLFFFTGLHPDYHRPSDDFEKINLDGTVRITDMVTQAARFLATVPERPTYQETGPGRGVHDSAGRAYLGVQLSTAGDQVVLSEVLEDGPAAESGLLPGDRIVSIDGDSVDSIAAVQQAIARQQPGDVVEILVLRQGQEIRVVSTLGERP